MGYLVVVIELVISVGAGIVSSFFVSSKGIACLIGIGIFFCIEMVKVRVSSTRSERGIERLRSIVESIAPVDVFSELALIYGLRATSRLLQGTVEVSKDQVWDFWKDCISRARTRWSVLTYTKAEDTWNLGWGSTTALAIQKERIANGCHIERIFLVDSQEELEKLYETAEQQREIGVEVYYLFKSKLLAGQHCRNALDSLGTSDIAVADGSWVYRTLLNSSRDMVGASATRNQDVLKKAEFILREVKKMAHEFKEAPES